ncbi:alpha/beta fold hydrolase [Nocardia panacis]|uniref:Alpha/beta fold hydrolase n=1 Tax=Nocardia panacis TaxID=2340916 RepID=A0A3A4K9D3_9NOCA|nr:alpha/beta hydrolase [Nocardia panacis]RJO69984.1 alpha/beta fold hydrolase [Nocardia panacis]
MTRLRTRFGVPEGAVPAGRMIDLPNRGTTYLVDIPGPPGAPALILLHGVACTARLNWFPALTALSERFRVLLFDQRWHGRGIRAGSFRVVDCADDIPAVLDALGLESALCAGYSLGGAVTLLAARRHPNRMRGLVLCATPYRFRETLRERAFHRTYGAFAESVRPCAERAATAHHDRLRTHPVSQSASGEFTRWALRELRSTSGWSSAMAIADIGEFDATAWLPEIAHPTAVVITTRDHAIPVRRQLEMATMIPDAAIHLVNAGHTACVLRADRFVPVLVRACDEVAGRSAKSSRSLGRGQLSCRAE